MIYGKYRILIISLSGLGSAFVWFVVTNQVVELDLGIQWLLLWLAFLGASWAARESFDQKNIAGRTVNEYTKQLHIEQQPFVVIDKGINLDAASAFEYMGLTIKNIGRGPALDIQVSADKNNRDRALFRSNEPPVHYLGSGEKIEKWKIDEHNFEIIFREEQGKEMINDSQGRQDILLYIFFKDQLGDGYINEVRLRPSGTSNYYKVMRQSLIV